MADFKKFIVTEDWNSFCLGDKTIKGHTRRINRWPKSISITTIMKLLLLAVTITIAWASCAQTKVTVINSYGFFRQGSRGTLRVDENNNPAGPGPEPEYVVYVETLSAPTVEWKKAWISNQSYDVFATKVDAPLSIGAKKDNGQTIRLNKKTGSSLWELKLQKGADEAVPAKNKSSVSAESILVKGVINKRLVYVVVKSIEELTPFAYP